MSKELKRVSFEIEHFNGSTYMGFELSIKEDGSIEVLQTHKCDLAGIESDYLFQTDSELYRLQATDIITEGEYCDIVDCYEEHADEHRVEEDEW